MSQYIFPLPPGHRAGAPRPRGWDPGRPGAGGEDSQGPPVPGEGPQGRVENVALPGSAQGSRIPLPGRRYGEGAAWTEDLADQVAGIAARVVASGAISANGHGNVSVRVPGAEGDVLHRGTLAARPSRLCRRPGRAGRHPAGGRAAADPGCRGRHAHRQCTRITPTSAVSCTRTPPTPPRTRWPAVPIGCWIEAMAMFGLQDGVPVAGYGPRGSAEAIANIRAAITRASRPCCWPTRGAGLSPDPGPRDPGRRRRRGGGAGQYQRRRAGRPRRIPPDLRAAALQRAMTFDSQGTVHA